MRAPRKTSLSVPSFVVLAGVSIGAAGAGTACKRDAAPTPSAAASGSNTNANANAPPEPASSTGAPATTSTAHLDATAKRVLDAIAQLETTKDVTCWTSFRQLDNFISSARYSNFAALAKITAIKALVRASWEKASKAKSGPTLEAGDLAAAVAITEATMGEKRRNELAAFAKDLGMKAYKDYRTTSEHWRVVLAVVEDEIDGAGATPLKPLSPAALDELAELTTRLSLVLLQGAGRIAQDERSPLIEAPHVKRAHDEIAREFGLTNSPREARALAAADVAARLAPLTKALIEGKTRALQVYNKDSKDLVADLNRVSKIPLTQGAVDVWMRELKSFTRFVASGFEPMQADNFLADGNFAPADLAHVDYVDAARAENATMQVFPHVILPNGDVKLRLEPNPGAPSDRPRKSEDVTLLDYQQNAVRDTAVHWIVMDRVWKDKPYGMDPFAAEYLSEVVSMMVTYDLLRAEAIAKAAGANQIDETIARQVRDKGYVLVLPRADEAKGWTPEQWKKKEAVLAKYPPELFHDVTKAAGLPTTPPKIPLVPENTPFDIQTAMGAGIAVGDVDGDGYTDLFQAGEGAGRLYVNRGKDAPGHFVDATAAWGIPDGLDDSRQPLFFDMDGDGDLDLLVLRSEKPSLLLEQDRRGHFVDVAAKSGFLAHRGAHTASIFDVDGDGDLDIYVGYYGSDDANRKSTQKRNLPSMDGKNGSPHELYRRGADGKYTEVAAQARVADTGWTLATSAFDYDNDGDLDLFLANDFGADVFYRNDGHGAFDDVARITQTDDRGSGMNVSFTDVNGDGWLDFYVSNIDMFSKNIKVVYPSDRTTITSLDEQLAKSFQYLSGNKLFVNPADPAGNKPFVAEQASRFEPGDRGWGWTALFFDYENDGDDDMYLSNGWLEGSFAADQKKQMFVNDGGTFYLASPKSPEAFAANGRSVIGADLDRDGDVDIVVNDFRQPPVVLDNAQATKNHHVGVRLHGAAPNTRAIGARITVAAGGRKTLREVTCGIGYLGQDDELYVVGIGDAAGADVTVRWPGGTMTTTVKAAADATIDVKQGT